MMREALTVAELNEYVRRMLAGDPMLRDICLRGELSNLKRHISGHWYFTLKDTQGAIQCVMFRQAANSVSFRPEDGQQVKLSGNVGLYAKTGQYQFYADGMELDGLGEMYALFEERKQRLAKEGLFDPAQKKPIPLLPKGIGIVTSKTGAVVHDIVRVGWRRNEGMPFYLCPVGVQGEGASLEIAEGIELLDKMPEIEVIIVGRGGGSLEDLWAFNEEAVVRAIYACQTPVISAVGHETDFTLADFAADLRAPTPSAAAELAVQPKEGLLRTIQGISETMERICTLKISLAQGMLSSILQRLAETSPEKRSQTMQQQIREARQRMETLIEQRLREMEHTIAQCQIRLRSAGPENTLSRGYAIVLSNGKPVHSVEKMAGGDDLCVLVQDGKISAKVIDTAKEEPFWRQKNEKA